MFDSLLVIKPLFYQAKIKILLSPALLSLRPAFKGGLWHRIAYGVNLFYLIFIFVA